MWRHRELIVAAFAVVSTACAADTFVGGDASTDGGDAASSTDGAPLEAGADAAPDALPPPLLPVSCGQSACTPGEACCVYTSLASDGGITASTSCNAQCPAPTGGQQLAALGCTSTADCSAGVCCIHRQSNVDISACEPACISSNNEVQLCDPQAADAGCSANQPCSTTNITDWSLPTTFATCGGQGVP